MNFLLVAGIAEGIVRICRISQTGKADCQVVYEAAGKFYGKYPETYIIVRVWERPTNREGRI